MAEGRFSIGDATLVRVPYAEVLVDPAVVSLTVEQVDQISWAAPRWAEHDQVRVAAAVWMVEASGHRLVVDPAQAADPLLRSGPDAAIHQKAVAAALASAGCPRESIDTVIASHIDGIGMIAWRDEDRWSPFFPNAIIVLSHREYDAIAAGGYHPQGSEALLALYALGAVALVDDEHAVTDEVTLRWTGGHSPGHQIVEIRSRHSAATMLGHLALSPLHCAIGACSGHVEPAVATAALHALRDSRQLLIGPLWPTPGAARWTGTQMEAVPGIPTPYALTEMTHDH